MRGTGKRRVRTLPAEPNEPRGVTALARLGERLIVDQPAGAFSPPRSRPGSMVFSWKPGRGDGRLTMASLLKPQLLFFGGKGGVGKTTAAAAAAIRIARAAPKRRVLLLSTDPAHSLADVLAAPVSDVSQPVTAGPPNLDVRELDAAAALAARRGAIEASLREISDALGTRVGMTGASLTRLMDLAPPGIDELFGILSVIDVQARYHSVIVDTAPTGHAVRLLELPEAAREWVQVLLRVLLKYRALVRPGQFAAALVALSREIRALQELLHDAGRTRFVVVTRAAELPRRETARLLTRLRRLRIAAPVVVVNARTLAPGACPWCRTLAASESREVERLAAACRGRAERCVIIQAPLAAPPPRGAAMLERWSKTWIA
jgi:arsenite-transporting ATPase